MMGTATRPAALAPDRGTTGRLLVLLSALALAAAFVVPFGTPAAAEEHADPSTVDVERLEGEDRHQTACDIALETFDTAATVIVTRSDDFPDTLSGNYLAGQIGAPVLITAGSNHPQPDTVDDHTAQCLDDLGADEVIIVGGTDAVSQAVEDELADDYTVERIGGGDRHETAALVAERGETEGQIGTVSNEETDNEARRTAIIASAADFPDALVAGGAAYDGDFPLFLTPYEQLDEHTEQALGDRDIEHVLISGGPDAVSATVDAQLEDMGISTERIAGPFRMDTAIEWVEWGAEELGWTFEHVNLARGDDFPDALAIGPHAGEENAGLLITWDPDNLTPQTEGWLADNGCALLSIHIAGGTDAVSQEVEDEAREAAEECPPEEAADGQYSGDLVALSEEDDHFDADVGEDEVHRFFYSEEDGDEFYVILAEDEQGPISEEEFECVARATIDEDATHSLDIDYASDGESQFGISTEADTADCFEDETAEAEDGQYTGEFVALDEDGNHFDADVGEDDVQRFLYSEDDGDSFFLILSDDEQGEMSEEQFECVARTTIDEDATHSVEIDYASDGESEFTISTDADVDDCFDDNGLLPIPIPIL